MTKALLRYNYPQIVFGKCMLRYLRSTGDNYKLVIDCPCGNGETAWYLSRLQNVKIVAADLSPSAINNARQNFSAKNIEFKTDAIENVLNTVKGFDAFCLVNSLFLLENYNSILEKLWNETHDNKAKALIIIPNTEGKNFKWFQSQNSGENKLEIAEKDIEKFFSAYGFKTETIQPICYTNHYNRRDVKLFSVFWSLYLGFLNSIRTVLKIGKPNYFLVALSAL